MKSAFALSTLAAYASATAAVDTCALMTDKVTNNTWNVTGVTGCAGVKDGSVKEIVDSDGETTGLSWKVETATVCTAAVVADAEAGVVAKAAVNKSKKYVVTCAAVGDTDYGVSSTDADTTETCVETITQSNAAGCRNDTEAEIAAAKALAAERKPLTDAETTAMTALVALEVTLDAKIALEDSAKIDNAAAQKLARTPAAEAVFVAQAALDTCTSSNAAGVVSAKEAVVTCTETNATGVETAKAAVATCTSGNATKVTEATAALATCVATGTDEAPADCDDEEEAKTDAAAATCTSLETAVTTAEAAACTSLETAVTTAEAATCTTQQSTLTTKTAALTAAATAEATWKASDEGKAKIAAAALTQTAEDDATAAVATAQAAYDAQLVIVLAARNAVGTFDCDQEEGAWFDATSELDAGQCVTLPEEDDTTCETCYVNGVCYTMSTTDETAIDFCGDAEDVISGGSGLIIGLVLAVLAAIALGVVIYCFCCKSGDDDEYQKQN